MTYTKQDGKLPTRISTTFSTAATAWLNQQAAERCVTVSEVLRRIVDEVRHDYIVAARSTAQPEPPPKPKKLSEMTATELPERDDVFTEWQYGRHIDTLPVENNPPGSNLAVPVWDKTQPAIHPGEVLAVELRTMGLDPAQFAARLDVPVETIAAILDGRLDITPDMSQRLGKALGVHEWEWLNTQKQYEARKRPAA